MKFTNNLDIFNSLVFTKDMINNHFPHNYEEVLSCKDILIKTTDN